MAKKRKTLQRAPVDRIERWPVAKLVPYAQNPRTHSPKQIEQIAASMKEFGQAQLVVVDEKGIIIAGHGRVLAAQKLGWKMISVGIAIGWSEPQKRAYRIADNQIALTSAWDAEYLKSEMAGLDLEEFDVNLLGFNETDLASFGIGVSDAQFPDLPNGSRGEFRQISFIVHVSQLETIKAAIEKAKEDGASSEQNENSNGNAIAAVCAAFMQGHQGGADLSSGGEGAGEEAPL